MDTAQWPQETVVKPIEEIVTKQLPSSSSSSSALERKAARPQKEQALNCPRCNSTNTKFCYYNNYSLTQPRYVCKTCRRYWTEGGSLRNIPVGGGSRKNKRSSSSSSSSSLSSSTTTTTTNKKLPDLVVAPNKIHHESQDLNLTFPSNFSELIQLPNSDNSTTTTSTSTSTATAATCQQFSALELLTGISSRGCLNSFMPMVPLLNQHHHHHQDTNFALHHHQDFKPSLNFSLDGIGNNNNNNNSKGYATATALQETATAAGRPLFPFEYLKQVSTTTTTISTDNIDDQQNDHNNREHGDSISAATGYWTGMLGGNGGGGGSW